MGGGSDDWTGRMNYLERRFQLMIRESNKELTGEILALEAVSCILGPWYFECRYHGVRT